MLGTLRLVDNRRIFSDSDIAIGIDLPLHEGDGGDMAFTDSPEADDKPYHTLSVLHGMWHDGRIEERGGFQCILLGEERTDEPLIIIAQLHICRDAVRYVSVMFHQYLPERLRRYF